MEFSEGVALLRKYWLSILFVTMTAFTVALVYVLATTPVYQAQSQVFVSMRTGGNATDLLQGSTFTQSRVKSYAGMVTSPAVLSPVIARLGLSTTPEVLARSVTAESPSDTVLINITVEDGNPQKAADVANAIAGSLGGQVTALEKPLGSRSSPVRISFLRNATVPSEPASPRPKRNLGLGLLLGLALGVGQAGVRQTLDTKVRSQDDLAKVTKAPVLARIAYDADAPAHPVIAQDGALVHRSETFRRLRTNLQFVDLADRPRTIIVTSAVSREGRTTTAVNLAIALADAGTRVLLLEADLRRPSVAGYLSLKGAVGLTTVLVGQAELGDAIQQWGDGPLHVLTAGQVPPNPSELLASDSMTKLLDLLSSRYDIVLIDTPPLLPVADAAILAKITGGALVVAAAGVVHRHQVADALRTLGDLGVRVLGVVLNRAEPKEADSSMYSAYANSPMSASGGTTRRLRGLAEVLKPIHQTPGPDGVEG